MMALLSTAVLALVSVGVVYAANRMIAGVAVVHEYAPFLAGQRPAEHALSRYHARWYPASIVFLAFDVEMLFMYPWALVVAAEGPTAVVEMFTFLAVLLVGVAWAKREGAFRWV